MVDNFYHRNIADITIFKFDDEPIAYLLGAKLNKIYYAIETAYKQKYFDLSPGMLLHLHVIKRLCDEQDVDILDFGYDASYKVRWTDENRPEKQITIYNNRVYPKLISFCRKTEIYSKLVARRAKKKS